VSDDVMFRRFEPAEAAAVLALRRYLPGESPRTAGAAQRLRHRRAQLRDRRARAPGRRRPRAAHASAVPPEDLAAPGRAPRAAGPRFGETGDPTVGYRVSLREEGTFRDEKIFDVKAVDVAHPKPTIMFGEP